MTWMGHKRVDETMLYVHVAEPHHREIPSALLKAGSREADPERRILAMLSERCSAWQQIGSRDEKTPEIQVNLGG